MSPLLLILLVCLGAVLFFEFGYPCIYSYRLSNRSIEFSFLFFIIVKRIPIDDFMGARRVSFREVFREAIDAARTGESVPFFFTTRLSRLNSCVLLTRKSGWFRQIVLTPRSPEELLTRLQQSETRT